MRSLSPTAKAVLETRYLWKGEDGKPIETIDDLWRRVAYFLYDDEPIAAERAKRIFEAGEFLPNSPTIINAGRENGQLSACFVLPIEDSMEGIFETLKHTALIHKTGGGTGFSFSRLRSKGSRVKSTGGEASGVVSFLEVYNAATESVKQGGVRRGANMGLLRVDHPEIIDFILCKDDPSKLTNFNLSVGVTDEFMQAVTAGTEYAIYDPTTKEVVGHKDAREVWNLIVHQAWKNGEPGIIFLDEMNRHNPTPEYGEIESTNPCGEQPLLPYESCNLGSINLAACVTDDGELDTHKLSILIKFGIKTLNKVLDHNCFPLDIIRKTTLRTRKIGLGVMGWADMLLRLGIPYDSEDAVSIAGRIMSTIQQYGSDYSTINSFHNATITTIAPTGTISMIADCSSGIEPNFSWVYTRNSMDTQLYVVHPIMAKVLQERGIYNDEMLSRLHKGTPISDIPELADLAPVFKLSHEIAPEWHVKMQAAFQEHTDNAVSKTINLPHSATEEDVANIYMMAYELKCKGTTVYRDGSRDSQVLNFDKKPEDEAPTEGAVLVSGIDLAPRPRAKRMVGATTSQAIGCGHLLVTVNRDDLGMAEVTVTTGKHGGCQAQSAAIGRLLSIALRSGVKPTVLIDQLKGIRCSSCIGKKGLDGISCPDATAKVMEMECEANEQPNATHDTSVTYAFTTRLDTPSPSAAGATKRACPNCGYEFPYTPDKCMTCPQCGSSTCNG